METLDFAAIAKKLPPHLQGKLCPEFGTINIPHPNPLDPREVNVSIQPMPCVGEMCAKWDHCQGPNSPKSFKLEFKKLFRIVEINFNSLSDFVKNKAFPVVQKLGESRLFAGLFK